MYGDSIFHRVGVGIGCLGFASLTPYGVLSPWVAVILAVLPLVVFELGAELCDQADERDTPLFRIFGWHIQAYGALLFLTPFAVFFANVIRQQPPDAYLYVLAAAFGVPTSLLVIIRWRLVLLGRDPRPKAHSPAPPAA